MQALKKCTSCGRLLPATLEYFGEEKRTKIGLQAWCRECFNEYRRHYREEHKAEERQYQRKRQAENPERGRERLRLWRKNNPDKVKNQNATNHDRHREKRNADARQRIKVILQKFPERWIAAAHKRRALRKQNGGTFTGAEWNALKAKYSYRCLRCGRAEPEIKLTVDHVIPLSKGGSNNIENIQPLCRSCNTSKKAKHIDYRNGELT